MAASLNSMRYALVLMMILAMPVIGHDEHGKQIVNLATSTALNNSDSKRRTEQLEARVRKAEEDIRLLVELASRRMKESKKCQE